MQFTAVSITKQEENAKVLSHSVVSSSSQLNFSFSLLDGIFFYEKHTAIALQVKRLSSHIAMSNGKKYLCTKKKTLSSNSIFFC